MSDVQEFISLADLYRAYSKAKSDAFYDKSHFNSLAYAAYEQRLETNLKKLLRNLNSENPTWFLDERIIGGYSYLPKSIEQPGSEKSRPIHFATLDPLKDWENQCRTTGKRVSANFRQVITPTVDFQVISALWIMKVGHLYDRLIDRKYSYAHKIRRVGSRGPVAEESRSLFEAYIYGYQQWRSRGLRAMKDALERNTPITAVTMDIRAFYHNVSASFLLNKIFLKRHGLELSSDEYIFTANLITAIETWYSNTPDYKGRPAGSLPVGLTASRVISNVLLAEFDKACASATNAVYYGRYADDIFLVVESPVDADTGEKFIKWLRKTLQGWLVLEQEEDGSGLRLKLPYAPDSTIIFSSDKQKIFFLSGDHGIDLVNQIVEKINEYASEYRNLPELPDTSSKMAAQALLATPDARLEADALRKAEAVSIRRLGFSLLLGDVEAYARDLDPKEWREIRYAFYGLVSRYVLTPVGYFDYFTYIIKVFSIMIACGDTREASNFLNRFDQVCACIRATSSAGKEKSAPFELSLARYYKGFAQAAYESATVAGFSFTRDYLSLLKRVLKRRTQPTRAIVRPVVRSVLKSDLGRRPYFDYWFNENKRENKQPDLPSDYVVKRALVFIRKFRGKVGKGLNAPYWPAIAYSTRQIPIWNLCVSAPNLMFERGGLERAIRATRGSQVNRRYRDRAFIESTIEGNHIVTVPSGGGGTTKIGVPSYLTTSSDWQSAFNGKSNLSLNRYVNLRRLINRILSDSPDVRYLAFPECSIPLRWALEIASKLGQRGISFIAGIENRAKPSQYRNEALISLSSDFFGKNGAICFLQPKIAPAHIEADQCSAHGFSFQYPHLSQGRPIYVHGDLCLGVLICSDLTTIDNRAFLQGKLDMLFVLEWNPDTGTFEFLVESAAHDLHAAIVQVNNRSYGDSRIRMPYRISHMRDVVQVKGGDEDFYVVATLNFASLRSFQRNPVKEGEYKPLPIGYQMSKQRRESTKF